jgi:signal transduction histidine kinase
MFPEFHFGLGGMAIAVGRDPHGREVLMNESERLSRLRHDLSNPLSALLAETQLLLLNESRIDPETLTSLREIEALAIRMRAMLREI